MRQPAGWRGWARAGVTVLALALAACGTPRHAPEPAAKPATEQAEAPPRQSVLPEAERLAAASPADVAAAPALPGPERLAGLTAPDLSALLGPPGFVRRDPPAEVWQYGTETCVLDLFLYADGADQPPKVSYFEFRGRTVTGIAPGQCYQDLLAARPRRPAG
jgi:hypothetical protein